MDGVGRDVTRRKEQMNICSEAVTVTVNGDKRGLRDVVMQLHAIDPLLSIWNIQNNLVFVE